MEFLKKPIFINKPFLNYSLTLLFPATFALTFIPAQIVSAKRPAQEKTQIKQIQKDLSREKEQFLKYDVKEKDLLGELSSIERKVAEKREFLKALKEKIKRNKKTLKNQQDRISRLHQSSEEVRIQLSRRLIAFYKHAKKGYIQLLATSEDLDQLRKRMQYLKLIMHEDQRLLRQMMEVVQSREQEVAKTEKKVALIKDLERTERDRVASLKKDLDKKVILLMKIHQEKEFYETAVRELQVASLNLKETLITLDREQKRADQLPVGFGEMKGKLIPPLRGRVIKNRNPLGAKGVLTHKGIFIKGPIGAEVRAVFPGRVDFSGWLKGFGQMIVINHGSRFFTISAHLSRRNRDVGDIVRQGSVIGLVGQSESLLGPQLYFEIRKAGSNLDPVKWLKVH
ncbi:murein hydrolase activator EnvC family protein [Thermodesulfobacteriota bacterium]